MKCSDLSEVSQKIVPFFFPIFQLFGLEQAAAPVCAVQGFIGWWAVIVFGGACVCAVFDW